MKNSLRRKEGSVQTRCSDGNLRLVGAGRIQHAQVPSSANWTVSRIQIEPDSQLLFQAINRDEADQGASGVLFKESIFLNFICFQVSFCPRACKLWKTAL
jgi:hypothetical protein